MNYADLPLQQRIDMAADYAVILITDHVTEDEIIRELASQFSLTEKDALVAYAKTRTKHREHVNKRQNESIRNAVVAIFFGLICAVFYLALGEELGWPVLLFGGFFLLAAFAAIGAVMEKLMERLFFTPGMIQERLERHKDGGVVRKDWSVNLFTGAIYLSFFASVIYLKQPGVEEVPNTIIIRNVKLKQPIQISKRGDVYQFQFEQFPNQFQLKSSYLDYTNYQFVPAMLQPGDTFSIEVPPKEYFEKLQLPRYDEISAVELRNLIIRSRPLISWTSRNEASRQQYKEIFLVALAAVVLSLLVMIIRHKMAAYQSGS